MIFQRAVALVFATCLALSTAQNVTQDLFEYLAAPELAWSNVTTDSTEAGMGVVYGNGVYISPDNDMVVSTSFDATLRAFDPITGAVLWTYVPTPVGTTIRCFGGVAFNYEGATPYLVYAVADGADNLVDNPLATTYVCVCVCARRTTCRDRFMLTYGGVCLCFALF
jgi:outer membrane protein assembly factor BamB